MSKLIPICLTLIFFAMGIGCEPQRMLVDINPLDGYFPIVRPGQPMVLVLDEASFIKNFGYAATMNTRPTPIHFETERVAAIVYPETTYTTDIEIDEVYQKGNVLHICYSVQKAEERNFAIAPAKLISFEMTDEIKSVSFECEGVAKIIDL